MNKCYLKSLTVAMLLSGSALYAQIDPPCMVAGAALCDNFDAYTAGEALGPGASWWTTWSGTEGGSEDALVSADFAYSGANSALIPEGGTTDAILKLGNLTTGKYHLTWQMYIPDTKIGYYNIQESETPGVAWNLEVYFGNVTSGTGDIIAPTTATFTYPVGEWFEAEHIIDLDANTMEIYYDGVLVLEYEYLGSIGAIDFYSAAANNKCYIDDVVLMEELPAAACAIPGAIFCDNIDTYTAGDAVGPYADWWSTWSGVEGGAEDGIVSDAYAFSGDNSVLIPGTGTTDALLLLDNMTTGIKRLEWQMYIPSGKTAYYNIQESEVAGIAWNLELYFGDITEGQGEFTVPAAGPTFTYPVDEWFLVEHIVDLDADNIKVYIDGVMVLDAAYTGSLGSVDCFSWSASNTYYLDDILYIEEEVVVVEPCAIPGAIFCDNIDTYTAGDAVGPYADWWSTWSGVEGGAEDGIVSDDYAFSGDNSVLIPGTGTTDALLLLDNMTTGIKRLEWQMYIPSGKTAYYNIQESEVAGIAWNLELYFGDVTEGQGEFTVPAAGPTFTYPVDEWFLVEHIVDLDADNIKVYIDGVMVLDAAYTGSLGSVDCFSWSASNTYYLDDILYIEEEVVVVEPCDVPGAVFCDNMDTYEEGALGPNADWWSTWSGVEGGAEDGLVSSDFAASAPNSALIPEGGVTDVILKLGNLSSGKYNLYWNMYVPSGSHAYYNIQETEVPGVAWNAELYFGLATPGEGEITVPAELTFTYPPDAWFLIEHIIDMDANTIEIKLNGTVILSEIYEGNMGGVDFYSIDALNRYYLDDVALMPMDPTDLNTYYQDADSDTYGNADVSITVAGDAPTGYVENNLDCDDTNPDIYPGAIEVLNNKDDDCDELIDEGLINIETLAATGMAIQVYPVPANNNVTIELMSLMSGEAATFEIYNTTGQVVYTEQLVLNTSTLVKQINIESLGSGIYMVKLTSGEHTVNGQIIVQH
jgi:hypothetical protein